MLRASAFLTLLQRSKSKQSVQLQKIAVARPMTLWRACCSARTVQLTTSGTLRSNLHRRRVCQDEVAMLAHSSNAGQVMQDLNNLSMSKENPRMKAVKRCIDQVRAPLLCGINRPCTVPYVAIWSAHRVYVVDRSLQRMIMAVWLLTSAHWAFS